MLGIFLAALIFAAIHAGYGLYFIASTPPAFATALACRLFVDAVKRKRAAGVEVGFWWQVHLWLGSICVAAWLVGMMTALLYGLLPIILNLNGFWPYWAVLTIGLLIAIVYAIWANTRPPRSATSEDPGTPP